MANFRDLVGAVTPESVLPGLRYRLERVAHSGDADGLRFNASRAASYIAHLAGGLPQVTTHFEYDESDCVTRPTVVMNWNEGASDDPRVLQIGHIDVVPFDDGPFGLSEFHSGVSDRRYLVGRGTIDNAGNDLVIGGSLGMLRKATGSVGNVTVVLSGDEELASPTSRQFIISAAREAEVVLGYEGAGPNGEWVDARLGAAACSVMFRGASTHSVYPSPNTASTAANFVERLERKVLEMQGKPDQRGLPQTLLKVGAIRSSSHVTNMSPSTTEVIFSLRQRELNLRSVDSLVREIAAASVLDQNSRYAQGTPVVADAHIRATPSWSVSESNRASGVAHWAHSRVGNHQARAVGRFGGSDTAFAVPASKTALAVDGLGARSHPDKGFGPHTAQEAMCLADLGQQMFVSALLIASGQGRRSVADVRIPPTMSLAKSSADRSVAD
jgi:acetylornithine deacetylase/succinyl-diaminopimelate desuccinylase-like protein